jgi:hypothetical protein
MWYYFKKYKYPLTTDLINSINMFELGFKKHQIVSLACRSEFFRPFASLLSCIDKIYEKKRQEAPI